MSTDRGRYTLWKLAVGLLLTPLACRIDNMAMPEDAGIVEQIEQEEARRLRGYRRLKRGGVLLVVLIVGIRLVWGWEAARELQAEIDRCHAAGDPILVGDFPDPQPIPDEENAATYYYGAILAVRPIDNDAYSWDDTLQYASACKLYPDEIAKSVEGNAGALRLVRNARRCNQVDWGFRFTSPLINKPLWSAPASPETLTRLLVLTARLRTAQGKHAEAIEALLDMEHLARALGSQNSPSIVPCLDSLAAGDAVTGPLEEIIPRLDVSRGTPVGSEAPDDVDRGRVEQLILSLLDDETPREAWHRGVCGDRAMELDSAHFVLHSLAGAGTPLKGMRLNFQDSALGWALRPMFMLDATWMVRCTTVYVEAGTQPRWSPLMSQQIPSWDPELEQYHTWCFAHILRSVLAPGFYRPLVSRFRTLADRRMAAVALAIRLFELDHGHRPASLQELVPGYLKSVPEDPFAGKGTPLGYRPDADEPVLYSINSDGLDDNGEFVVRRSGAVDRDQKDLPYFLNGNRPLPSPPPRRGRGPLTGN